jgi:hypothetical protein
MDARTWQARAIAALPVPEPLFTALARRLRLYLGQVIDQGPDTFTPGGVGYTISDSCSIAACTRELLVSERQELEQLAKAVEARGQGPVLDAAARKLRLWSLPANERYARVRAEMMGTRNRKRR